MSGERPRGCGLGNIGPDPVDTRDRPLYSHHEIDQITSLAQSATSTSAANGSKASAEKLVTVPNLPPIYAQGDIGSCTSNATLAALRFAEFKFGVDYAAFEPSRMFLYRNARIRIDPLHYGSDKAGPDTAEQLKTDTGGFIRTNIVSLLMDGVCTEELWPYVRATHKEVLNSKGEKIQIFSDVTKKPNPIEPEDLGRAQFQAKNSSHPLDPKYFSGQKDNIPRAISYYRVYDTRKQNNDDGRGVWQYTTQPSIALLEETLRQGWPFIFGIKWEEHVNLWYNVNNGVLDDPPANFTPKGGHAMLAVGFDSDKKRFLVQNSWGPNWNTDGKVWIPYAYFTDSYKWTDPETKKVYPLPLTYDFWVIKTSEVKR